jgi:outer membrane receptor protein involved in Fe transport
MVWSGGVNVGSLDQVGAGGLTDINDLGFWNDAAHHVQPSSGGAVTGWVLGSPNVQAPQYLYAPNVYTGTYNITPYYEQGPFSASVSYGWRSSYLAGGYVAGAPSETVDAWKELDLTAAWKFNDHFSVSFDGLNLLDSTYLGYLGTKAMPVGKYKQGREYLARFHFKM